MYVNKLLFLSLSLSLFLFPFCSEFVLGMEESAIKLHLTLSVLKFRVVLMKV
jgi:hypothetical protein